MSVNFLNLYSTKLLDPPKILQIEFVKEEK